MARQTELVGAYKVADEAFLREKSERDDPRAPFYLAMLENQTYEAYLAEVGGKEV